MPRWLFAAAVLTLAVAFPAAPARAGWFSSHGGHADDCCPTCAAPPECCPQPACCAPVECYPVAPECCAPGYDACGEVYCDGSYGECEEEGCLKRCFKKLWHLEQRKNRCLKDTFFGWRDKGGHGCHDECADCAPLEYYQPGCATPYGLH